MHHINSWNSSDLPVYRKQKSHPYWMGFCFAASFYFSSTTLYCTYYQHFVRFLLLLLPQRYEFSSKSQPLFLRLIFFSCCCCYRKGTNFQANHNPCKPDIFEKTVVVATAKVRIFKQITTLRFSEKIVGGLLLLPQRYEFSSKSQLNRKYTKPIIRCCCYRKGTNFQANHNGVCHKIFAIVVVVATAKVRIFKQITTDMQSSITEGCCCCYRKGTNFQANHN